MKAIKRQIDGKYGITEDGELVNTATGEPVPEDTPLFLFRGEDYYARQRLIDYKRDCIEAACTPEHINGIDRAFKAFESFGQKNPERMKKPD